MARGAIPVVDPAAEGELVRAEVVRRGALLDLLARPLGLRRARDG